MVKFARVALASILLSAPLFAQPQGQSDSQRKYVEKARKGAEQGDAKSQAKLAFYYQIGSGVEKSDVEAANWYRKAAEQGDAEAQFQLGAIYAGAKGLPQDYAEAARWYRKAADLGDPGAQFALGEMYEDGRGVPQEYVKAHMWINLAVSQLPDSGPFLSDDTRRKMAGDRDKLAAKMPPQQIAEAQHLAQLWKPTK